MKKLIAGNWKMNGSAEDARRLIADIVNKIHSNGGEHEKCEFVVFPPMLHISAVKHSLTGLYTLSYGAQDCSIHENGAFTGDVSAEMIRDYGCSHVILGHSERRGYYKETSEIVAEKARLAHEQQLITIICVGETQEQRDAGEQDAVVEEQLEQSIPETANEGNTIIAYEPVWAIGTGNTATSEDIKAMHGFIRKKLAGRFGSANDMRILYGGSVKPDNAAEILSTENVDGALVGGASLNANDYLAIALAA